jgi:hypothetical protein
MKSPNGGGDRVPSGHLLSPNEAFVIRNGLYLVELLVKMVTWESSNKVAKTTDSSTQNDRGVLLLRVHVYKQHIEHGESGIVHT